MTGAAQQTASIRADFNFPPDGREEEVGKRRRRKSGGKRKMSRRKRSTFAVESGIKR